MPPTRDEVAAENATVTKDEVAAIAALADTSTGAQPAASHTSVLPRFAPPDTPGDLGQLGKYRILQELGQGGMGAVYLAFDGRLRRKVALKVMLPSAAANPTAKERFLREARSAARISSDYVVNIFEAEEIDGIPYIALQYLQGSPLDRYLRENELPPIPQAIRIARETAEGLADAHQLGLVHRDIKPANLWLEAPSGRVKILDFGLAKPVVSADRGDLSSSSVLQVPPGDHGAELTGSGGVVGTPAYMAPEQGSGGKVDGRADLFSLGCVLYRLVTGRLPFDAPNAVALLMAVAAKTPTPVEELNPTAPPALADLIRRLMAKKPADRPKSARAVADELATMLTPTGSHDALPRAVFVPTQLPGVRHDPATSAFADLTEPDSVVEDEREARSAKRGGGGNRGWLIGSLAATMLVMVVAGFIVLKITSKDSGPEIKLPDNPKGEAIRPKEKPKDTDREAAITLLDVKGVSLTVRLGKGEVITISGQKPLPPESFVITEVSFSAKPDAEPFDTAKFLQAISKLEHLEVVFDTSQNYLALTDGSLAAMAKMPFRDRLRHLECNIRINTNTAFALMRFPALAKLGVSASLADAEVFRAMRELRGLRALDVLNLADAVQFEEKDWAALAALPLKRLALKDPRQLSATACAKIAAMPDLKSLQIYAYHVTLGEEAALALTKSHSLTEFHYFSWGETPRIPKPVLAAFAEMKSLHTLGLSSREVNEDDLSALYSAQHLRGLVVSEMKIGEAALKKLSEALPRCKITHATGVIAPPDLDRFAAEYIIRAGGIVIIDTKPGVSLSAVAELPKEPFHLAAINLINKDATDDGLEVLAGCAQLKTVNVQGGAVTPAGLKSLAGCKTLHYLTLFGPVSADATLASIRESTGLVGLSAGGPGVTDAGLEHLKGFAALTNVALTKSGVTIAGLRHLSASKGMKLLDLRGTKVDAKDFAEVQKLFPLAKITHDGGILPPPDPDRAAAAWVLKVGGTVIVNDDEKPIRAVAGLPAGALRLRTFAFDDPAKLDDAGAANFKGCEHLHTLDLRGTTISDTGLANFQNAKGLGSIRLSNRTTDAGLAHLKGCPDLVNLVLTGKGITGTGLAHFANCRHLQHLSLDGTGVTDDGLAPLAACIGLQFLHLSRTPITNAALAHFKGCRKLTDVHLNETAIDDDGLTRLAEFEGITRLGVTRTKVTAQGVEAWRTRFPKCKLESSFDAPKK